MEFTGKYIVKFFVFQVIFWICFTMSSQVNLTCVPLEHCPTVLGIIEEQRYSPEIMKIFGQIRCSHFKPSIFIWCPKPTTEIHKPRYPEFIESSSRIRGDGKDYKQLQKSTGFIWNGKKSTKPTSSQMFTTVKSKDLSSMVSGHGFVPHHKRIPETTIKPINPQSEIESRIYFPDEDIHQTFSRQGKSKALNDISSTCGRPFFKNSNPSDKDNSAGLGEFPWVTLLEYNVSGLSVPNCAGTLISSRHVLTAANCVHHARTNQLDLTKLFQVVLGELNTNSSRDCVKTKFGERCGDVPIRFGVESVNIHPLYNGFVGFFDIAILKLDREVEFSDFVSPICLPDSKTEFDIQNEFILASWQKHGDRDNYILKKASVALTGSKIYPIEESDLCTGFPGNPLMVQVSDMFYLFHIDAGGVRSKNCGGVRSSSVMVAGFRNWIDENLS